MLNTTSHTHTYKKININGNVKKGFFMKSIFTEKHTYTNKPVKTDDYIKNTHLKLKKYKQKIYITQTHKHSYI